MDTMSSALSSSSDFRISLCSFCTSAGMLDFFGSGCFAALGFAAVLAVTLAVLVTLVVTVLADVFFAGTFFAEGFLGEIGRAHVWTPVTNAHSVCRLLL